ncbi:phosphatase PAP2 family protein [Myxococcus sp. K38C18041901]|uniref:phosphatase PAP2 family protein n=1 Tax=Myxococcus guangdongensis TaxID=2906760 RepID=UPI0020A8100C|nr:phosphatase PAP2 family protein [Myxococcus guangdongensis]MCP3057907.1 phosphatase PAP2 family protein [Myxococcus guangdongensis]
MSERPFLHEVLLTGFGGALSCGLLVVAGARSVVFLQVLGATLLFILAVAGLSRLERWGHLFRVRLLLAYGVTFFFYASVKDTVPVLGLPTRDAALFAVDAWVFGGSTPSVWLQRWSSAAVSDVFSASYLSFHVYLHLAMAWAVVGSRERAEAFFGQVFSAYVPGLVGYYLVPAVGPLVAYPELFTVPVEGGWVTRLNAAVVAHGSSTFDVFPSLHVYITLVLLAHDRLAHPWRFRGMLPVAVMLFVSTLVLRYHYAVDLLAGVVWFVAFRALYPRLLRAWESWRRRRGVETAVVLPPG